MPAVKSPGGTLTDEERRLVEVNRGLVGLVLARRFPHAKPHDRDDLFSEGVMGLVRAAQLYDPARGVRFSTYATQAIWSHIVRARRKLPTVRGPLDGGTPAPKAVPLSSLVKSQEPAGRDKGLSEADALDLVEHLLRQLPARQALAVRLWVLEGLTQAEVGRHLGLSHQRVQQVLEMALERLRACGPG